MGGLLSEKFLDTNLTIPFAGPPLNTPSLQKYKRVWRILLPWWHQSWTKQYIDIMEFGNEIKWHMDSYLILDSYFDEKYWPELIGDALDKWEIFLDLLFNLIRHYTRQMVDAWGGWSLFQVLLQTLKRVASKHGVSIPTVAVKYILDQVKWPFL